MCKHWLKWTCQGGVSLTFKSCKDANHFSFSLMDSKWLLVLLVVFSLILVINGHSCGANELMESIFGNNETMRSNFHEYHRKMYDVDKKEHYHHKRTLEHYRIPVVFHVLQNSGVPVVTQAQLDAEIGWLNDWYSAQNVNYASSSTFWQASIAVASEFEISFEYASFDENGNPTNGILFYPNNPIADQCDSSNYYKPAQGGKFFSSLFYVHSLIDVNIFLK